jgi:sugar phosphate isomerase/epimerase
MNCSRGEQVGVICLDDASSPCHRGRVILGYNTNGFAFHKLDDALRILAEIGFESAAVTLERHELDPPDARGVPAAVKKLRSALAGTNLRATIETGARFLLDPLRKHQPTLISRDTEGRRRRIEFLSACIEIAGEIGADSVCFWSGAADDEAGDAEWSARLASGLTELLKRAEPRGVRLSLEPEPGMWIDRMKKFEQVHRALDHPLLGLTLDVGHVHCLEDGRLADHILRWKQRLWNMHVEDIRRGVHEHLPFGEGDVDFPETFAALGSIQYEGPVHVELPRQSHDAVRTARESHAFLCRAIRAAEAATNARPLPRPGPRS